MLSLQLCRHLFRGEDPERQKPDVTEPSWPLHLHITRGLLMVRSSTQPGSREPQAPPVLSSAPSA